MLILQCSLLQEHEFSQHTLIQMDTVTFQINLSHAINIAIRLMQNMSAEKTSSVSVELKYQYQMSVRATMHLAK